MSTPELKRHLAVVAADNKRDAVWMEAERFDLIEGLCDIIASHCVSAREAAWREDRELLARHLRSAREGLKRALETFNLLPGTKPKAAGD